MYFKDIILQNQCRFGIMKTNIFQPKDREIGLKSAMLAIMLIMIVLLVYRIIMIKQIEQTQVAKDVVRLHTVAASTILFYAMTILDINDTVALASYGLYFWCSDFLLILFLFILMILHRRRLSTNVEV